jgi:hypothetical protein
LIGTAYYFPFGRNAASDKIGRRKQLREPTDPGLIGDPELGAGLDCRVKPGNDSAGGARR